MPRSLDNKWAPSEVETEKRKAFTPKQKAIICERQNWLCNCGCGRSIKGKRHEFNHIVALALGGKHALENAEALLSECHKPHTDKVKAVKSKADAAGGRTGQYARRLRNGSRLKSRGFNQSLSKKLNGQVIRRDQKNDN